MKRLILTFALFSSTAISAPIDDAKYLLCRTEATSALKGISTSTRNYVWARDMVSPCAAPVPTQPPVVTPPAEPPTPVPIPQQEITVSGQTAFLNALSAAKGGETIRLADGSYSLGITNIRPASTVNVVGSRNVKFGAFGKITGSANIRFGGVSFWGKAGMADAQYAVRIAASENITFDGVLISGIDGTGFGIYVTTNDVKNSAVRNSELAKFKFAVKIQGGSGWVIEKNRFRGLSSDGVQISNTTGALIAANDMGEFAPCCGFHPDAIQMAGPNKAMRIIGNIIRGKAQGIFSDGQYFQDGLAVNDNNVAVTYPNTIRVPNSSGTASGNVIDGSGAVSYGKKVAPILQLGGMKSDGTNVIDGRRF